MSAVYDVRVLYGLVEAVGWWVIVAEVSVNGEGVFGLDFPYRQGDKPTRNEIDRFVVREARPVVDQVLRERGYGDDGGPWAVTRLD
jgi:hypothetical protein